jgi:hypothetical protein
MHTKTKDTLLHCTLRSSKAAKLLLFKCEFHLV